MTRKIERTQERSVITRLYDWERRRMNQNKMIILDYEAGHVTIIDCPSKDAEAVFEDFCDKNNISPNESYYMTWDGKVTIW